MACDVGSMRLCNLRRFGVGSKSVRLINRRRMMSDVGPLRRMTPMPLRPGGVPRATIVSLLGTTIELDYYWKGSSGSGSLERDAQAAGVTLADRFGHQIGFLCERQMND